MDSYGRKIISVTGTGTFLSVVNTSSLLIAIPTIIVELKTSFFIAIWIIVAYALSLTVLTPILGKYSDIVGRKKLYSAGYLIFFIGSVISAASLYGTMLLIGRVVQGIGGAFLFSNSLAIITDTFRTMELRKAMGINAAVVALGTSIGPLIGGILTDLTWRAIFLFNIPISIFGFIFSTGTIKDIPGNKTGQIDTAGAFLMSATVITTIVFMTLLPGLTLFSTAFSVLLIAMLSFFFLFVVQEIGSKRPIIDTEILRSKILSASIIALVGGSISRFSMLLILTLYFQGPLGYSPLYTGMLMIPFAGIMGIFSFLSGYLREKASDLILETLGLLLTGVGSIALGLIIGAGQGYFPMSIAMMVAGAGSGMFYTPNSTIIMLSVGAAKRGETAGIRTLMVNLGTVFGLTMVFLLISAYVPNSIVNSIFFGIRTSEILSYVDRFNMATTLGFLVSGVISLLPIPIILLAGNKVQPNLSDNS